MRKSLFLLALLISSLLVLVACSDMVSSDEKFASSESARSILEFSFDSVDTFAEIDEENTEIIVYVPEDTDITYLLPELSFDGDTVSPDPDEFQDFSEPIAFTVTALDGSETIYLVTVKVLVQSTPWLFEGEPSQFAEAFSELEDGDYRITFPDDTFFSHDDLYAIRDTLATQRKKLVRLDFSNCEFEDGIVPKWAFSLASKKKGIPGLASVILPETVTAIESFAFEYNKNLQMVVLPQGLKSIRNETFFACTGLRTLSVPSSIETLGDWVFGKMTEKQTINMGVEKQGKEWPSSWNHNCKASIHWHEPLDEDEDEAALAETEDEDSETDGAEDAGSGKGKENTDDVENENLDEDNEGPEIENEGLGEDTVLEDVDEEAECPAESDAGNPENAAPLPPPQTKISGTQTTQPLQQ